MTPEQITLIKESWAKVEPISDQAAELFYGRLFETEPSVKPLFKGNMESQGQKLMTMIGVAVNGLDKLDEIVPAVQDLGRRHVGYGVKDEHYPVVGAALLWTLEKGLGDAWNDDLKAAWAEAYGILSSTMIAATKEAEPEKPKGLMGRLKKMFA